MGRITPKPQQIRAWVISNFPNHKERKNGSEIIINNPFDGDTKKKFNISTKNGGLVHDWRPGHQQWDGSFLKFVCQYRGISFKEAVTEVCGADISYVQISKQEQSSVVQNVQLPSGAVLIVENKYPKTYQLAIDYLSQRGIALERASELGIHYTSTSLVFPYYEYGELVYWQSRNLFEKRFEFPSVECGVVKSDFIYGFDNVETNSIVCITEAIFDAIVLKDVGIAIGGDNLSLRQVSKIRSLKPSRLIITPDNDDSGRGLLATAYRSLSPYFAVYYCLPPDPFKDWNEMGQREGWSVPLKYIENTYRKLTVSSLVKFRMGLQ